MSTKIPQASPAEVREYLDLLELITKSFTNPSVCDAHLDELPEPEYSEERWFILRMIGKSNISIGKMDRDMLRNGPVRKFNDARLDAAKQIHLAHNLVTNEMRWRLYSDQKKELCTAHGLLSQQIDGMAERKANFSSQALYEQRWQDLARKLLDCNDTLMQTYQSLITVSQEFCQLLNQAYTTEYMYGHPWVRGALAPAAPEGYSETAAYYELQRNEFYASQFHEVSCAVHLRQKLKWKAPVLEPVGVAAE